MSLITVDLRDRKQLYEQLVDNIKNLILTGELKENDKLPSVRSLARELGINPNTIQKAYSELERCGVILTLPGRGSIVVAQIDTLKKEQLGTLTETLIQLAREAKSAGVTKEEFMKAAETAYEGGAEHD
ncbi:MAG: GntR family transcriptional regulator [Clostridia bacterium]|nr:GntR family transcriptional regulator [Clostridia bacterium]